MNYYNKYFIFLTRILFLRKYFLHLYINLLDFHSNYYNNSNKINKTENKTYISVIDYTN